MFDYQMVIANVIIDDLTSGYIRLISFLVDEIFLRHSSFCPLVMDKRGDFIGIQQDISWDVVVI